MESLAPGPLSPGQIDELERAFRLLGEGQVQEALTVARRLAAEVPSAPDAHHVLAMCLSHAGDVDASDAAFRQALRLAPAHPLVLANYAAMLRKSGRPNDALPYAERAVKASPSSFKHWFDLASTAHAAGEHGRAMAAARGALTFQPDSVATWQLLGNAARSVEDLETAERAYAKVTELDRANVPAQVGIADVRRRAGRPDRAILSIEQAILRHGPIPALVDALSGALLDAGDPETAIAMAERVTIGAPDYVPGLVTLANLLWEYGGNRVGERAPLALFRNAIADRPNDTALRVAFARFLSATDAPGAALEQIRWVRSQADAPWLRLMEAQALDQHGDTRAARVLHDELHRGPTGSSPACLNAFAWHLLQTGDPDAAREMALAVTRVDRRNQEAWSYLATAYRLLDDPREFWLCDYERLIGVVDVAPPPAFSDQADFLAALAAALDPLHRARHEPMQQSLRGGSQTPGRLFGRPDPVIEAARQSLLRAVEGWIATLPDDRDHPFLGCKRPRVRIGGSWSVKLWSSGKHANHTHSMGWMSSAFYVSLPPSVRTPTSDARPAGAIQFGQPPEELGLGLPPRRMVRPEIGKLVLFPSYMWHGTVPFQDAAPRMTIAFDMVPFENGL